VSARTDLRFPSLPVCLHLVSTVCVFVCAVRSRRERESQHRLLTPFTPFPMGPYMYAPIYLPPHYHHDKR
jgi:hypothetical protein